MNDSEIYALISLLDDDDTEVREHVRNKLRDLGEKVIPHLNNFLKKYPDKDPIKEFLNECQFLRLFTEMRKWKDNESDNLLKGIWLVNTYHQYDLSLEALQKEIEQLFYEVWVNFRLNLHPLDEVRILNNSFFNKMGFRGNFQNFHDIHNSLIENVLATRKGNPISLCIIYLLIAQKLRLPIKGVNAPNIFLLIYESPQIRFYIDVFNNGAILSQDELKHHIVNELNMPLEDKYYMPCRNRDIVRRVMENMKYAYKKMQEYRKSEWMNFLIRTFDSF